MFILLYKYEYLRIEQEDNKKTYVVRVSKEISDIKERIDFFIDSETGLISKIEMINGKEEYVSKEIINFNYKFDILKGQNIEKPDISKYKDYKINTN